MKNEELIEFRLKDYDAIGFFKRTSKKRKGNWDGEALNFTDQFGSYDIVSLKYPNGINIGVTNLFIKRGIRFINESSDYEKYFAIRIGFHGGISNVKNEITNSEGIFMYDATQSFEIIYAAEQQFKWFVIRIPYSFVVEWGDLLHPAIKELMSNNLKWNYYSRLTPEIESLVRDCFMISKDVKQRRHLFYARAFEILGHISNLIEKEKNSFIPTNIHKDDLSMMLQLKEELLYDFAHSPEIETLSKKYHMSISKLQRSFKAVYGMPILKFFNLHRLEEAHRQIKYSSKTLLEISENLGFNSLPHFSAAFKKHFGFPPIELRS
ncbi:helix-turn-helix transcriptional regulator [Sediminitomix flava]|uniref:AraC-like DNA-binding protein n=1 Tax=Sediminitomix flava TaxID=379075 RepID=A0A315ZFU5_SEDFL|nr:AraC family transcriptional regulator [Sediminitomix flava]PWJ44182.1 AraC-like DNA-binding protein [Sediminitomix flava]